MSNVLVVVGSRERAEFAKRALTHPQIKVEAADKEDQIVAALTGQRFDLAIVGGKIGQRGPLILCEAVRLRRFVCPGCGALLDTETALAGDPFLDDVVEA